MRRPPYHRDDTGRLEVRMTPMIDVIFLLLIFFVSTASFQLVEEVLPTNLSLPGTTQSDAPIDPLEEDLDEIVVKILWQEGRPGWQVNQRDYHRLEQVRADVPIENVIDVYDLCRQIGLERIQFAASVDV